MSVSDELTPEERAAADAAVARLRAERDVAAADERGRAAVEPSLDLEFDRDDEFVGESADEMLDRLEAEQAGAEDEDFDAFWSSQGGGKVLRNVCGRDLQLPRSMPLRFEMESKRLAKIEDTAAVIYLFDMLFGEGTWADLISRGIDGEQLPVLFLWASVNITPGQDMSLSQAKAEFDRMSAEKAAGKTPALPRIPGATSGGTGPSSKPTSSGSTGKRRKRSKR